MWPAIKYTTAPTSNLIDQAFFPPLSPDQVESRTKTLTPRMQEVGAKPENYFETLAELTSLRGSCNRYLGETPALRLGKHNEAGIRACLKLEAMTMVHPMVELQAKYFQKFGNDRFSEAAKYANSKPERQKPNFPSLFPLLYTSSLPFALVFLLIRLKAKNLSILLELFQPGWKLVLATLAWPVGIFTYPDSNPTRQALAALRFSTYALAACLSGAFGLAKAQDNSSAAGKKRWAPTAAQVDFRISDPLVGANGQKPSGFARLTLNWKNFLIESVSTAKPANRYTELTAGYALVNTKKLTVNAVAGPEFYTGGAALHAGMQIYLDTPRLTSATPVLRLEHQLKPGKNTFNWISDVAFKLLAKQPIWLGGEINLSKSPSQPTSRSIGPLIRLKLQRLHGFFEAAIMNQAGVNSLRLRLVHNF